MASTDWVERPREAPACASSSTRPPTAAAASPHLRGVERAHPRATSTSPSTAASGSRITGANGAGKTTLLQLLLGTLEPAHGEVHTATTVRLLPQTLPRHRLAALPRPVQRHRGERGAHAARPLRPRRRRDPPPAGAPQPRAARPRRDRRAGREPGRPAAARRAHQPPRLRHARGAGDAPSRRARARSSPSPTTAGSWTRSASRGGSTSWMAASPSYARPPWPPAWLREGPVSWGRISAMSSSDAGTE